MALVNIYLQGFKLYPRFLSSQTGEDQGTTLKRVLSLKWKKRFRVWV